MRAKKIDPPYPAVAEFRRRQNLTVPEKFMTGWVNEIYLRDRVEIDEINKANNYELV